MTLGTFMKFLALCGYPQRYSGGGGIGLKSAGIIAQSGAASSVTGTLTPATLASIAIPANTVAAQGALRIIPLWSMTNNANNKTMAMAIGGTTISTLSQPSIASLQSHTVLRNRNNQKSQVMFAIGSTSGLGVNTSANGTASIDFTVAQTLTITGTLGNVADTLTLEGYTVEVINP